MCGIAGIISCTKKYTASHLTQMTEAIAHRGPDGNGHWIDEEEGIYLGHRRLSIIDLSVLGAQPMHFLDRYVIIHNGEVYNYRELKSQLQNKGYEFKTTTDTEVIVAAYDHFRSACLELFEGMFAFAIWDKKERKLFMARDRMGEKPLYYFANEKTKEVFFASELKALWSIGLPKEIREDMLIAFLALGNTCHPIDRSGTFYKGFFQLEPGHFCIISPGQKQSIESIPYWKCPVGNNSTQTETEIIGKFQQLFQLSISNRLRSDVSIGTSLSGGLDSSSVVASIHQQLEGLSNYSYHSFTAVFPGYEKNEQALSGKLAKHFSLSQHLVNPNIDDLVQCLPTLIKHHEEPISSASVYAQYKVFEQAKKQGIKVLLDGQGADEILGGYNKYKHWFLQELLAGGKIGQFRREKKLLSRGAEPLDWGMYNYLAAFFPNKASNQLEKLAANKITKSADLNTEFVKAYYQPELSSKPTVRSLNDILYNNSFKAGLGELLRYADKNSMAFSCELRLPFLYHPLVEFVFSLPSNFKIRDGKNKWLLRQSMQAILPSEIVQRTDKIGFEPPQQAWMEDNRIVEYTQTAKQNLFNAGVLSRSALDKKIQPHSSYAADAKDWRYLSTGLLMQ